MKWQLVTCGAWSPEKDKLLAGGWEPFAVTGERPHQVLWLRRQVSA